MTDPVTQAITECAAYVDRELPDEPGRLVQVVDIDIDYWGWLRRLAVAVGVL